MANYLTLTGDSAFTRAEAGELRDRINNAAAFNAKVAALSGAWIYYVHLKTPEPAVAEKLARWLDLPPQLDSELLDEDEASSTARTYYVTPRTISPWSSKGTSSQYSGVRACLERPRGAGANIA